MAGTPIMFVGASALNPVSYRYCIINRLKQLNSKVMQCAKIG